MKLARHQSTNTIWFNFCEVPGIGKLIETPQRLPDWGLGVLRLGEMLFNRDRVTVWDDEKIPKMVSGDFAPTVLMHLMPLDCTPEKG